MTHVVRVSANFRKKASDTIQSIIVFIIVYILLVLFAIGLTIACGWAAFQLLLIKTALFTLLLGAGITLMGILVLVFMVKFIFHKSKTDVSGLVELSAGEAPELIALIEEVAREVGTQKPKKVYLSAAVNASVFYDSSFWSMFLPVRKNLTIGVALVNSLTVAELKAIIAHEFGHFSQRSMKLGAYTYYVNKVIHNMLYENNSYQEMKTMIAGWHSIVLFFANMATAIIGFIQRILKSLYKDINTSYSALSREMEFHADEIAASVTGTPPIMAGLLRLGIAEASLQITLQYYNGKVAEAVTTDQFFARQRYVLEVLGKENQHPFENGFPMISRDDLQQYNHSKLVITDQWASHPSISDRVNALEQLNLPAMVSDERPAMELLPAELQQKMNAWLFETVKYEKEPAVDTVEQFAAGFQGSRIGDTFPKLFNGYYNSRNPALLEIDSLAPRRGDLNILYGEAMMDRILTANVLAGDRMQLEQLVADQQDITSFDYDGVKYPITSAREIAERLEKEASVLADELTANDQAIYSHFLAVEKTNDGSGKLARLYRDYMRLDREYDEKMALLQNLSEDLSFTTRTTPYDEIEQRFEILKNNRELEYKNSIRGMLTDSLYRDIMTPEESKNLANYVACDWTYFENEKYHQETIDLLYASLQTYREVVVRAYFHQKKLMLNYFEELEIRSGHM